MTDIGDRLERLRDTQEFIGDSLDEPVFHVKTERSEWAGGWQAFANWVVIERPRVIEIAVSEWEDLTDLDWDVADD